MVNEPVLHNALKRFWSFTRVSAWVVFLIGLVLAIGPTIEGYLWPVSRAEAFHIQRVGLQVTYLQHVEKLRDCPLTALANWVEDKMTHKRIYVSIMNENGLPVGTSTRALGESTYGPYKFNIPLELLGTDDLELNSMTWFYCHGGWLQQQTRQILDIPPDVANFN